MDAHDIGQFVALVRERWEGMDDAARVCFLRLRAGPASNALSKVGRFEVQSVDQGCDLLEAAMGELDFVGEKICVRVDLVDGEGTSLFGPQRTFKLPQASEEPMADDALLIPFKDVKKLEILAEASMVKSLTDALVKSQQDSLGFAKNEVNKWENLAGRLIERTFLAYKEAAEIEAAAKIAIIEADQSSENVALVRDAMKMIPEARKMLEAHAMTKLKPEALAGYIAKHPKALGEVIGLLDVNAKAALAPVLLKALGFEPPKVQTKPEKVKKSA